MKTTILKSGIIQIGNHFEAFLSCRHNHITIWREFSKIVRLNAEDALLDAQRMVEDYKSINKV